MQFVCIGGVMVGGGTLSGIYGAEKLTEADKEQQITEQYKHNLDTKM